MFVRDYEWYLRHLMIHVDLRPSDIIFAENVAAWCREHGVKENDERRPLKFLVLAGEGPRMVVAEEIPNEVIEERINALRIRGQLRSVTYDQADLLDTATKKLAYLFLKEYAAADPRLAYDDRAVDEWVLDQMDRLGVFLKVQAA